MVAAIPSSGLADASGLSFPRLSRAGLLYRRHDVAGMSLKRRGIMNAVAVTVLTVAALRLYTFFNPHPPAEDLRPHKALGRIMADEAIRLAGGSGRIIVIGREISEFKVPAAEAQLGAFQEAVKKAGRSAPVLRLAKVDPLRTLAVPPAEFFEVIRQAKEDDVIVSFLGAALLTGAQLAPIAKLGPKQPKVLAVCPQGMLGRIDLPAILGQGLVVKAAVGRSDAPAVLPPGDDRRAFDQVFKLIDQGNLADLATISATPGGAQ